MAKSFPPSYYANFMPKNTTFAMPTVTTPEVVQSFPTEQSNASTASSFTASYIWRTE
ncbi:hypothetical protein HDV02_006685, partial [Globomyces sp. JEL0801]